jgi:hypothetical protein
MVRQEFCEFKPGYRTGIPSAAMMFGSGSISMKDDRAPLSLLLAESEPLLAVEDQLR